MAKSDRPRPAQSPRKDLSLRWLEVFQICAEKGSLQAAAEETGLSISTVSHHLRSLEEHLGIALFDHRRRPLVLTTKGRVFWRSVEPALLTIRRAQAEASAGDVTEASYLRLGAIDDFDSDITPELAVHLAETMPRCDFSFHTDMSHTIIGMLHKRQLDVGITSTPPDGLQGLVQRPFLRDPFLVVAPAASEVSASDLLDGRSDLPFLRFSSHLIIARQIEGQLKRLGLSLPPRFECSSNPTLMAMVASGAGWGISTPLHYTRARRFHDQVRIEPFPARKFARVLAVLATPDCAHSVIDMVDRKVRELVTYHAIDPMLEKAPWLKDSFALRD